MNLSQSRITAKPGDGGMGVPEFPYKILDKLGKGAMGVEGQPLSELIPRGGISLERIFDVAIPLADALATARENGIVHRDVKLGNVMVTDGGRVNVLDFGPDKL